MQFTDAWKFHPFHGPNNVNGVDADPEGRGLLYNQLRDDAMGKKVLALQEAYLRKVVDTVNDLDNVLYEACNETGEYGLKWQYHVIDFVHAYEARQAEAAPGRHDLPCIQGAPINSSWTVRPTGSRPTRGHRTRITNTNPPPGTSAR